MSFSITCAGSEECFAGAGVVFDEDGVSDGVFGVSETVLGSPRPPAAEFSADFGFGGVVRDGVVGTTPPPGGTTWKQRRNSGDYYGRLSPQW